MTNIKKLKKIHKEFNRDVGDQLFEKIRIQSNGLPSVMDFIKIYLEAEAILLQKISACQYNLENLIYQKDLQIMKLQTLKNNPTIDPSMTNSILKVVILEAQNLKPLDWKIANNCFAFLNCNGFVYKTKAATSTNPRWNETCEL